MESVEFKVETSCSTIALIWFCNQSVYIVSSYVSLNQEEKFADRTKKAKHFIIGQRPYIIETYYKLLGDVDLLDSM